MESVTIDRLTAWLTALGRTVEIRVRPYDARKKEGHLVALICPKGETVGLGSCHIRGPLRLTR